jgi:gas vesicle protein
MKSILFVLLAGVAVGLLIAPEKGSKSWKKLVASLDDVKNKTMEEIDNLVTKSKDLASKGKGAAKNAAKSW